MEIRQAVENGGYLLVLIPLLILSGGYLLVQVKTYKRSALRFLLPLPIVFLITWPLDTLAFTRGWYTIYHTIIPIEKFHVGGVIFPPLEECLFTLIVPLFCYAVYDLIFIWRPRRREFKGQQVG